MTGPPRSSPTLLVALLVVTALLGLVATTAPEAPPVADPSPASEAALATSTPIDEQGWLVAATTTGLPLAPGPVVGWDDGWDAPPAEQRGGGEWGDDWGPTPSFRPGDRVRGLVLDGQGRPRGEVAVELRAGAGQGPPLGAVVGARGDLLARGRTGPDGQFVLVLGDEVGSGCRSLDLAARDPADGGLALAEAPYRGPAPDGVHELDELRLGPAHRVEVRALRDGQPLAGASVEVSIRSGAGSSLLSGSTDERGALALDVGATGGGPEVELVLRAPGRASVRRELGRVTGPCALDVSLPPEAVMWGRVVDPLGRPVAAATVMARPAGPELVDGLVTADAEGDFVLWGLAEGPYAVQARAPGGAWAPADAEVALPSPALVLRLEVPGAILVTLVPPSAAVDLELLRAGAAAGAWAPAVWDEREREGDRWGDDWGPEWGGPVAPPSAPPRLGADQRRLLGLTPGRYWLRARDPVSGAASAPVELLVGPGAEEPVTLTLVDVR